MVLYLPYKTLQNNVMVVHMMYGVGEWLKHQSDVDYVAFLGSYEQAEDTVKLRKERKKGKRTKVAATRRNSPAAAAAAAAADDPF